MNAVLPACLVIAYIRQCDMACSTAFLRHRHDVADVLELGDDVCWDIDAMDVEKT